MKYRTELSPRAARQIRSFELPDHMLVEIYLRLRYELAEEPARYLQRSHFPIDGMVYQFSMVDPANRLCKHFFKFLVVFSQDEERLIVQNVGYERHVGA